MSFTKRYLVPALVLAAVLALSGALAGCGEQVAATWAHGQILESDVTTQITSMQSSRSSSSSSTTSSDDSSSSTTESWEDYIKNRSYDSDASDEDKAKGDGTVAQLREYAINTLMKTKVVDYEVEQKNYTISDDELDAYVDEQRTTYESYYGQGMSGTFESILQLMGYKNLAAFKEEAKETLKERKLQKEVTGKDESEDDFDQDAWDAHVKELVSNSDLHINDMPSDTTYDPSSPKYSDPDSSSTSTDTTTTTTTDSGSSTATTTDGTTMTIDGDGNMTTTSSDGTTTTTSTTDQNASTSTDSGSGSSTGADSSNSTNSSNNSSSTGNSGNSSNGDNSNNSNGSNNTGN